MDKRKPTFYTKRSQAIVFLCILAITIFVSSCSQDLFEEQLEQQNRIKVTEKPFSELEKDKKFNQLMRNLTGIQQVSRSAFENQNGFTIAAAPVKVITTDSVTSYTMLIERDVPHTNTTIFENLVIQENKYSSINKAYRIKYTPTTINPSADESFYFDGTAEIKSLAFTGFNRGADSNTNDSYVTIIQIWCSQPYRGSTQHHIAGPGCSLSTIYFKEVSIYAPENCDNNSSGTSGAPQGGNGTGNTGGGTGNGGNNGSSGITDPTEPANTDSETITSPVLPEQDFGGNEEMDTPCKQLSAMSSTIKSNVKTKLNELAPYTNQEYVEYGFEIELINKAYGTKEFIADDLKLLGTMGGLLGTGPTVIGSGHNHPINGHSMFSFTDVCHIKDIYNETKPSKQGFVFIYIAVKDKETGTIFPYALKIEDFNALTTKVNEELAKPDLASLPYDKKLKALDLALGKKYDKNPTDLEKVFLEEYKLFGISLYKSDNLELNNWKKLELKTDGTVGQVPCNN